MSVDLNMSGLGSQFLFTGHFVIFVGVVEVKTLTFDHKPTTTAVGSHP
jgi:hypothetical protein